MTTRTAADQRRVPVRIALDGPRLESCGIGLRKEFFDEILDEHPPVPWFEIISENFMVAGGRPRFVLERVRRDYPIACHGVSLSIGSAEPLDRDHLRRLAELIEWIQPTVVSDHLCWSSAGGHSSHDLLPLARTEEMVRRVAAKVRVVQDVLGRRILLENVSSYVEWAESTLDEAEFVAAVAEEADCGLLLDVNNLYVNARNHGLDPYRYLERIPRERVRQFHLAGHEDHDDFVIDTHDRAVRDEVWSLYAAAVRRFGALPSLVEWDARIPSLEAVWVESRKAEAIARHALAGRDGQGRPRARAMPEPRVRAFAGV